MERVQFITHKEKKILLENFSNLGPGHEFDKTLKKAQVMITSEPNNSVLAIFDATGCSFNSDMINKMKKFTTANAPYIKQAAVVGMNGLLQAALSTVSKFSGREFVTCKTREEAMDLLAEL